MCHKLRATPRRGRGGQENANEHLRSLMPQVNTESYDIEIPYYLHQLMDDWEEEPMGSISAKNQTDVRTHNFWVVKNLLDWLILCLICSHNDPMIPL